jgi:hypothetical protein
MNYVNINTDSQPKQTSVVICSIAIYRELSVIKKLSVSQIFNWTKNILKTSLHQKCIGDDYKWS